MIDFGREGSVSAPLGGSSDVSRVFLVGCPRSGTTLLQALLTAHSDIASFPESHIFLRGHRLRARLAPGLVTRRNLVRFAHSMDVKTPYMRRKLSFRSESYQQDLIAMLDTLTLEQGRHLWVEKTPNHVLSIPAIRMLVPSCRFIHLIRDGRAVVASLYEVTRTHASVWGGSYGLERCITEWNSAIIASSVAMESGDGISVCYQKLTRNPTSELVRICEFLGVEYQSEMLATYSDVTSLIVNSNEGWKSRVDDPIRDNGLQKYHDIFTSKEQEMIGRSLIALPENLFLGQCLNKDESVHGGDSSL